MPKPKVKMLPIRFIYTKCQKLMEGEGVQEEEDGAGEYQYQVLADKQAYNGQRTNMQPFWNNNAAAKTNSPTKEVNIM